MPNENKKPNIEAENTNDHLKSIQGLMSTMVDKLEDMSSGRGKDGKQGGAGPKGENGKDGIDGRNGIDGRDGMDGRDGIDGIDGKIGPRGLEGLRGLMGIGKDGKDGVDGIDGSPDTPYDIKTKLESLKGEYRLDAFAIKNLDAHIKIVTTGGGKLLTQAVGASSSPTFAGLTLSTMTAGSVLFAGTGGLVSQDNSNFFWDDTNNRLGIGTATPATRLEIVENTTEATNVPSVITLYANFTGGAGAAGIGSRIAFGAETGTNGTFDVAAAVGGILTDVTAGAVDGAVVFFTRQTSGVFTERVRINAVGNMGIGLTTTISAYLHLKAGTTAASTAPLKFNSGSLMTNAEAGAIEFLTDGYYGTITTGAARQRFAFREDNLSVFAATTSLQLLGVISDETGTGLLVFNIAPALTGTVVITGAATISTTLLVTGQLTVAGGIDISGGTGAAGRIYTTAVLGTVIFSKAGSSTDFLLTNSAGGTVFSVVTGTTVADFATTITVVNSVRSPLIVGGTTTTSTLTLRTTSGVGASGADIIFQVGNAGATEAMRILNSGFVGIGIAAPASYLEITGPGATLANIKTLITSNSFVVNGGALDTALYIPGIVWKSSSNNPTIPKAGIFAIFAGAGSQIRFGTSNDYSAGINNDALIIDPNRNIGLGTGTFGTSAVGVIGILNGTAPTTGPIDTVQIYSTDNTAGHTIPSFFCEGTQVLATGQADSASSVRVLMRINGTVVTLLAI